MVFNRYSNYYDTLYEDKNYGAECDFIETIFSKFYLAPVKHILDLGCGTGGHAIPLAQRGYHVTGIDRSEEMLKKAEEKARRGFSSRGHPLCLIRDRVRRGHRYVRGRQLSNQQCRSYCHIQDRTAPPLFRRALSFRWLVRSQCVSHPTHGSD